MSPNSDCQGSPGRRVERTADSNRAFGFDHDRAIDPQAPATPTEPVETPHSPSADALAKLSAYGRAVLSWVAEDGYP